MLRAILVSIITTLSIVYVASSDVVGLWLFDEGQGGTVKDSSGNGNDGVIEGAEWVDGKFGSALKFDGETTRVVIPSSDSLNVPEQVTVEAWIFPLELHDDINAVAQKWGDTSNRRQYQIGAIGAEGTARFYVSHTGTDHQRPIGEGISANKWIHIAGSFDGQVIRIFVNGKLSAELDSPGAIAQTDIEFFIGGYGPDEEYTQNRHFNGIIDEVRVSDVALTEDDLEISMQGFAAVEPGGKLPVVWAVIKSSDNY
ncbi:LamG domain-containing protein [Candidatus Poribacteria bacterium]